MFLIVDTVLEVCQLNALKDCKFFVCTILTKFKILLRDTSFNLCSTPCMKGCALWPGDILLMQIYGLAAILEPSLSLETAEEVHCEPLVVCCCVGVADHWTWYDGGVY